MTPTEKQKRTAMRFIMAVRAAQLIDVDAAIERVAELLAADELDTDE